MHALCACFVVGTNIPNAWPGACLRRLQAQHAAWLGRAVSAQCVAARVSDGLYRCDDYVASQCGVPVGAP